MRIMSYVGEQLKRVQAMEMHFMRMEYEMHIFETEEWC